MSQKSFEKLVKLMARLRSKNGCPWDRAQSHSSVKKHLIEEAYEVCDAMDSGDPEKFKDELGDLLFQVHAKTGLSIMPELYQSTLQWTTVPIVPAPWLMASLGC